MGLFSRHNKSKGKIEIPPMPPMSNENQNSVSQRDNTINNSTLNNENIISNSLSQSLNSPPIPSRGLDDIKTEVIGNHSSNNLSMDDNQDFQKQSFSKEESNKKSSEEALFDFSSIDIGDIESPKVEEVKKEPVTPISQVMNNSNLMSSEIKTNTTEASNQPKVPDHSSNLSDLNFISRQNLGRIERSDEPFFITTSEFKTFLEIVDDVKGKVKDSAESHLRLLDIKSEEDIEYENLRKNFQLIEDKLYEIDNIVFEK